MAKLVLLICAIGVISTTVIARDASYTEPPGVTPGGRGVTVEGDDASLNNKAKPTGEACKLLGMIATGSMFSLFPCVDKRE